MAEDLYKYFRIEARELLDQLVKGVLALEKQTTPQEIAQLLRWAHTLKGAARVVKLPEIADEAHRFEDVLSPFRDASETLPRERIDALFGLLDGVGARLNALFGGGKPEAGTSSQPVEPLRLAREDIAEMDQLLAGISEARGQLGSLHRTRMRAQRAGQVADLLADRLSAAKAREELRTGEAVSETRLLADELKTLTSTLETLHASWVSRWLSRVAATTFGSKRTCWARSTARCCSWYAMRWHMGSSCPPSERARARRSKAASGSM